MITYFIIFYSKMQLIPWCFFTVFVGILTEFYSVCLCIKTTDKKTVWNSVTLFHTENVIIIVLKPPSGSFFK